MRLTGESKVLLGIVAATVVIIAIAAFVFTKPAPTIAKENLIEKTTHTKGNPQASVYLVEFSDYLCAACKGAKPIVDQLTEMYKDKLLFAYRHYPLNQHPLSQKAAEAAEVAASENKFWEYSSLLFDNQEALDETTFVRLAEEVGLNKQTFQQTLDSGTFRDVVLADRQAGDRLGLTATPTFFLNGKKLELTTLDDLTQAVKQAVEQ